MIINGALSLSQKERGQKNYNRFNLINGLSYMCLGETIIILFAMRMNCQDYVVSALGSFLFLGNFAMPLGKFMASRIGATRSVSLFWVCRNIAAMLVASASVFYYYFGSTPAICMLMLGAFLFYACRSAGTVVMQPLIGEITTPENRGKFISTTNRCFYLSCLLCLSVVMLILRRYQDIWTLTTIIIVGSVFGFTSASFLYRIDESEDLRTSAKQPILSDVIRTLKSRSRLRQLLANYTVSTVCAMTIPISMLALKRGYGISDTNALLFALVQFAGAIATSYIIGLLSEETGPRPILILYYFLMFALCLVWVFAPSVFEWKVMILPFLLAGALSNGTTIALQQYFLLTIPNRERVASSLTIYVASGVLAGLTAMFLGGFMLKFIGSFDFQTFFDFLRQFSFGRFLLDLIGPVTIIPLNIYQIYFALMIFLGILGAIPIFLLKTHTHWRVTDVLGLAFAPRDILALYNLYSFNKTASASVEAETIEKFQDIHSELSEKALLSSLESPKLALRGRALFALAGFPLSDDGRKAILRELQYGEHTTANIAAQICGNQNIVEAIPLLRGYLENTSDYYLQSKAMLALAQLKDMESYPLIEQIFTETENPRLVMHGAAALAEIGGEEAYRRLLRKTLVLEISKPALLEVLCSATELAGHGDEYYKFVKLYKSNPFSAIQFWNEYCCALKSGNPEISLFLFGLYENTLSFSDALTRMVEWSEGTLPNLPSGIKKDTILFLRDLQKMPEPPHSSFLLYCLLPVLLKP